MLIVVIVMFRMPVAIVHIVNGSKPRLEITKQHRIMPEIEIESEALTNI